MFANNICITFVLWCNFTLIRLHEKITVETLGVSAIVTILSAGFLIVSYIKLGEINQNSKILVNSWRFGKRNKKLSPAEKMLMKKSIKSCRLLGIELANFGCYNKPTSIRIVGKLVIYTVKFLMMMSNLM